MKVSRMSASRRDNSDNREEKEGKRRTEEKLYDLQGKMAYHAIRGRRKR